MSRIFDDLVGSKYCIYSLSLQRWLYRSLVHSVCFEYVQKHHWECCVHSLSGKLSLTFW